MNTIISKFLLLSTVFGLGISLNLNAQSVSSVATSSLAVSSMTSSVNSSASNLVAISTANSVISSANSSTAPAIPLTISQTGLASSQGQIIFDLVIKNPNTTSVFGSIANFVSSNAEITKAECALIGTGNCTPSNLATNFTLGSDTTAKIRIKVQAELTGKYCHNATLNYASASTKANQMCVDVVVKNDIKVSQKTEYKDGILTWIHTIQNFGVEKDLTFIDYFPKNYQMDTASCTGGKCFDYVLENGIYYQSVFAKADDTIIIKISGKPKVLGNYCNTSQLYYFDNIIETVGDCVKYPEISNPPSNLPINQIAQETAKEIVKNSVVSEPRPMINPTIFVPAKKGSKELSLVRTGGNNQYLFLLIIPIFITIIGFVFLKKKERKIVK